jgi:hypothetical protein
VVIIGQGLESRSDIGGMSKKKKQRKKFLTSGKLVNAQTSTSIDDVEDLTSLHMPEQAEKWEKEERLLSSCSCCWLDESSQFFRQMQTRDR